MRHFSKRDVCLSGESTWSNGIEEALERIAHHANDNMKDQIPFWDARDISAFRYIAKLARLGSKMLTEEQLYRNWERITGRLMCENVPEYEFMALWEQLEQIDSQLNKRMPCEEFQSISRLNRKPVPVQVYEVDWSHIDQEHHNDHNTSRDRKDC